MPEDLPTPDEVLDTGPVGCGELLMRLMLRLRKLNPGQVIEVISRDPGAAEDVPAWCRLRGHTLLATALAPGATRYFIRRGPQA